MQGIERSEEYFISGRNNLFQFSKSERDGFNSFVCKTKNEFEVEMKIDVAFAQQVFCEAELKLVMHLTNQKCNKVYSR